MTFSSLTQCTYGGVRPLQEYLETEYVLNFLMDSNESFSQFQGKVLLMDLHSPYK